MRESRSHLPHPSISRPEKCLETIIVERLKVFLRDLWQQIELAYRRRNHRLARISRTIRYNPNLALLLVVTEAE